MFRIPPPIAGSGTGGRCGMIRCAAGRSRQVIGCCEPCRQQLACRMAAIGAMLCGQRSVGKIRGNPRSSAPGASGATAKARVEVDGLSVFAGSSPAPGRELRSSCWHPLSAPAPQAASPSAGLSFTALAYCSRLNRYEPTPTAPAQAPGGYYGLSQQNLRRPRSAAGAAGRAGG